MRVPARSRRRSLCAWGRFGGRRYYAVGLDLRAGQAAGLWGVLSRVEAGRVSIFEPINRFKLPRPPHLFLGYDVTPVQDLAEKVMTAFERIQPMDTDPMLNFDERDLFDLAENSGFAEVHLEYEARLFSNDAYFEVRDWDIFLRSAGNPKIPTLEEAMDEALTPKEIERFTAHLRPLVENACRRGGTSALAYLWAVK